MNENVTPEAECRGILRARIAPVARPPCLTRYISAAKHPGNPRSRGGTACGHTIPQRIARGLEMTDAGSVRVERTGDPTAGGLSQTIEFHDVAVVRDGRAALDGIGLSLREARIGIVGLNGSGKSTLLKSIIGLVAPTTGTISVDGRDSLRDARAVRADTGFLFQNPDNQIVFPIVAEDLAFGLKNHGFSKAETAERVTQALDRLGIARLSRRRIHELSGGEKQLVALAGVLAVAPKTVLFDEPTSQLDLKNRNRFRDTLAGLPEQAIVVAHDLDLLADFDRVLVIEAGRVVHDGAAADALDVYRARCR